MNIATTTEDVMLGVAETLHRFQQMALVKPILNERACVEAETVISSHDEDYVWIDSNYHRDVVQRMLYWDTAIQSHPDLMEWYDDRYRYWMRQLGYGHLLQELSPVHDWIEEGF